MKLVFLALAIGCIIFGNVFLVYAHEYAHQQIYKNFGVEAKMEFFDGQPKTIAESSVSAEDRVIVRTLHSVNEIVGYQTIASFNGLILFILFILLYTDRQTI